MPENNNNKDDDRNLASRCKNHEYLKYSSHHYKKLLNKFNVKRKIY